VKLEPSSLQKRRTEGEERGPTPKHARTPFEEWAAEYWGTKLNRRASTKTRNDSHLKNHVVSAFIGAPLGAIASIGTSGGAPESVRPQHLTSGWFGCNILLPVGIC